ncbi:endonuclease domain-containing protein [Arthrobacter sp. H5]|uniref:endonuclease domain-containing protein n=1 Tax=Arthrobacter sp. H5 TaxID=1267973 RepID=UPI0004B20D4A|nr:endonuclease domain-containing protein [Arthrobacter sp. H5]
MPAWLENEPYIHLSRPYPGARPQRKRVKGHSLLLDPADVTVLHGLPLTSVARTWLDLAGVLALDDLIAAGDYIVSEHRRSFGPRRYPKISYADLAEYLKGKSGHRWIRKARAAFEEIRVGVDSPPETRIRLILQRAGLPEFKVNCAVLDDFGDPRLWVDLGCVEYKTCIEYEGGHHLTPGQHARDIARDETAAELVWRQVKLTKIDVSFGDLWVVAKVEAALRPQGWSGEVDRLAESLDVA